MAPKMRPQIEPLQIEPLPSTNSWKWNWFLVFTTAAITAFATKVVLEKYFTRNTKEKKSSHAETQTDDNHMQEKPSASGASTQTDNTSQVVAAQKPIPRSSTFSHLEKLSDENVTLRCAQEKPKKQVSLKSPQSENTTSVPTQGQLPLAGKATHTLAAHDSFSVLPSPGSAEKLHNMDEPIPPNNSEVKMEESGISACEKGPKKKILKADEDPAGWDAFFKTENKSQTDATASKEKSAGSSDIMTTPEPKSPHKKQPPEDEKKNFNFFSTPSTQSATPQPAASGGWFSWLSRS